MGIIETIKSRRSVGKYKPKPVPENLVKRILEAARWAPSGLNNQPWRFVVVRSPAAIKKIASFTSYRRIVEKAPLLIAVFYDRDAGYDRTKDAMAIGAAIENLLLAASALGLGACWMGEILNRKKEVRRFLGTPPAYELMAVVTVGFPAENPSPPRRTALERLILKKI